MAKAYIEWYDDETLSLDEYEDFLRGTGAFTDEDLIADVATYHPLGFAIPADYQEPDENGAVI